MRDPDLELVLTAASRRELPSLIASWREVADERRWIARALRLDLAVLAEDPGTGDSLLVPAWRVAGHRR